jgi:hypothetical protein
VNSGQHEGNVFRTCVNFKIKVTSAQHKHSYGEDLLNVRK